MQWASSPAAVSVELCQRSAADASVADLSFNLAGGAFDRALGRSGAHSRSIGIPPSALRGLLVSTKHLKLE